jgi:hypothetical protein
MKYPPYPALRNEKDQNPASWSANLSSEEEHGVNLQVNEAVELGLAPEGADPLGPPVPFIPCPSPPPPAEKSLFTTPPFSVKVAADETSYVWLVSIPIEIHPKTPSSTVSPRYTYCTNGSKSSPAASGASASSSLEVKSCVLLA